MQPAVRVDYQPLKSLRATVKYSGFRQRNQVFNGTLPGFNDAQQQDPVISTLATTVNYNMNPTTFFEATYGQSQNAFGGCIFGQAGTGPVFCTTGIPRNDISNRNTAGLGGLPMIFPDALNMDTRYYAYKILNQMQPPFWVNGQTLITPTSLTWGNRITNAPPNMTYPGFLNINATKDVSVSVTKVAGRHTLKAGFYNNHSNKSQNQNSAATFGAFNFSNDTSNPIDAQFGFANAVLGVFTSYNQLSRYIEGRYLYDNTEAYVQDNWKVNSKLTLDYGVRFVHMQPQYRLARPGVELPARGVESRARRRRCTSRAASTASNPCSGANRQARNPLTGQFLGVGSAAAIGTIVPNTGNRLNGLFLSGEGITKTTYTYPGLGVAPRFGLAYDPTGEQRFVLRGGGGLFYDRPNGNDIYAQVTNPPAVQNVTVRYAQLQSLSSGLSTVGAPALNVYQYDAKLPSSWQWNGGVQMALPWSSSLDVAYTGQHSWNTPQAVNVNAVDFGTAFLSQYQDPTLAASATPGASAVVSDLMRGYLGYGAINRRMSTLWRTYHGINLSFQRRFTNGLSFGFNDSISLYDKQNSNARLQHAADGSFSYRADQAEADALFQTDPVVHTMKGNFIWDLPDLRSSQAGLRAIGFIVNDWQLSGIWTAQHRRAVPDRLQLPERRGQREPDRVARLRRARPRRRRSGLRLQRRHLPAVQCRRVPGAAGRQRRPRVRQQLREGLLPERARSVDREEHPAAEGPDRPAARRSVQCAQCRDHHRAQHHDEPEQPQRSGDDHEPAVRRQRQPDRLAVAAARRGIRRGDGLPEPADRAVADSVPVLRPRRLDHRQRITDFRDLSDCRTSEQLGSLCGWTLSISAHSRRRGRCGRGGVSDAAWLRRRRRRRARHSRRLRRKVLTCRLPPGRRRRAAADREEADAGAGSEPIRSRARICRRRIPITGVSPAEQQKRFLLPPGYRIEPDPHRARHRRADADCVRRQRPDVRPRNSRLHAGCGCDRRARAEPA